MELNSLESKFRTYQDNKHVLREISQWLDRPEIGRDFPLDIVRRSSSNWLSYVSKWTEHRYEILSYSTPGSL